MKTVQLLVFLYLLLLPLGSSAISIESDWSIIPSGEDRIESQIVISNSAGLISENSIEFTIAENTSEFDTRLNTSDKYFQKKISSFLYLSDFEARNKLLFANSKETIIPSLDRITLIYPFHSFL
jgi:hypothetical protein